MMRLLSDMLVDVADSLFPDGAGVVFVQSASVDLPLEVSFRRRGKEVELHADLPRWRWTTDFDSRPGHIRLELFREEAP
jgi:hypothetical protein